MCEQKNHNKKAKDVNMIDAKDKGLGLKCDEECSKYECINEHVGLAHLKTSCQHCLMSIEMK